MRLVVMSGQMVSPELRDLLIGNLNATELSLDAAVHAYGRHISTIASANVQ